MRLTIEPLANAHHKDQLLTNLHRIFGEFDTTMLALLEPMLQWVEISGGEVLFRQYEPGDCLYFVISGRLQAYTTDEQGNHQVMGEIIRGETVGEMAMFTGDPRSATIIALRDSVLVKLSQKAFEQIVAAYPTVSVNVTKLIINRLRTSQEQPKAAGSDVTSRLTRSHPAKKPVNICVLALHDDPADSISPATRLVSELSPLLRQKGTTFVVSSAEVNEVFNQPDFAQVDKENPVAYRQLSQWLDDQESQHEFMLYIADPLRADQSGNGLPVLSEWTRRCLRQADEILLLADATQPPDLTLVEKHYLMNEPWTGAPHTLLLLHPPQTTHPRHTVHWLAPRPAVKRHYHLRSGLKRDMARFARILSGTSVGLVLAGGGAKGFAHIGVLRALQEWDIPVDVVGGTSVGGLVAATFSFDEAIEPTTWHLRKAAHFNPTKDYNVLPFISLIRGRRIEQMIQTCISDFTGNPTPYIEDSWLTFFALSSNYTRAREEIHTRGPMLKYLLATSAIPGVFPPVIDGDDLLVDGGSFNNFPADVMSRFGVGKVIGVDLSIDKPRKLTMEQIPSPTSLLRDRFRAKRQRKYRLPSLLSLMLNATLLYSSARRNENIQHTDLYFNPDVSRYGIMNWTSYDHIVQKGYEHAVEVLNGLHPDELARLRA
ncbi:patatin-like phospholipase family protein [Spirosoma sp. KUDC1026]|uniref:patatin-like phospholipase family protein n=1 Tax=Spirosoma sp. KUDC1026 TaxID=2745947 RepID=UPI00159BD28A|nr:cyclic nucleotide-binding domain-containing protein [Spirosoma sp. KUDC1026]QKZ13182.1 cyclic nucleotide-binding domain-containing protein [Spirosoma sp. KUDC1026]